MCDKIYRFSWNLPLKPIKIPVFYYKTNGHIPHTFIFETDDTDIWGLPELEYPGLVKVHLIQSTLTIVESHMYLSTIARVNCTSTISLKNIS